MQRRCIWKILNKATYLTGWSVSTVASGVSAGNGSCPRCVSQPRFHPLRNRCIVRHVYSVISAFHQTIRLWNDGGLDLIDLARPAYTPVRTGRTRVPITDIDQLNCDSDNQRDKRNHRQAGASDMRMLPLVAEPRPVLTALFGHCSTLHRVEREETRSQAFQLLVL